jgi:5'-nucleotidase
VTAKNVLVTRDVADPEIASFVTTYKDLAAPLANKLIGSITATLDRYPPMMKPGLSTMGAVIADAQLAATAPVMLGGAQIAFMNPGGVRADLLYPAAPNEAKDGLVSYGEAFAVQPFGNSLVVMTLTGAQIDAVLEQQFVMDKPPNLLQVSKGFTFAYSVSAPLGAKVDPASIKLNGVTLTPVKEYRVTVNSFLAAAATASACCSRAPTGSAARTTSTRSRTTSRQSPISPPPLDRITELP